MPGALPSAPITALPCASSARRLPSGAQRAGNEMPDFEDVIERATRLLKGDIDLPGLEKDELRDRLLAGYATSWWTSTRTLTQDSTTWSPPSPAVRDPIRTANWSIMAVGDDDQSIYGCGAPTWTSSDALPRTTMPRRTT